VFVASGFENGRFPYSVLGNVLAAMLALGSIAALVILIRLSTTSNDLTLRRRLGQGEVPTDRLVIVNCTVEHRGLVRTLITESSRFVTIATRDPRLEGRLGLRGRDRVAVIPFEDSSAELVAQLRLEDTRELVLLSRSVTDDFDNLALLSALDAVPSSRPPDVPGVLGVEAPVRRLPSVVLQMHERELPALVDRRLGGELLDAVARPPFEPVVRALVVADAAGRTDDLRRLYATPRLPVPEAADVDRSIRIRGLEVELVVEPPPTDLVAAPVDAVGLQVDMAGRAVWRRFSTWRADEVPRPVTGTVVHVVPEVDVDGDLVGDAGGDVVPTPRVVAGASNGGNGAAGPRRTVHVVGGDGFAQRCALDLVASGVSDVQLLMGSDEPLLPGLDATGHLTVTVCDSELHAADLLAHRAPDDEAILVIEGAGDRGLDSDLLLERLSLVRLHDAENGRVVPPLFVCCRGAERAQRVQNFVVDKVIDVTWIESSYFAVFSAVYFDVVLDDPELAEWTASRQLAIAHRVASRLCHLDIGHPGDPRMADLLGAASAPASALGAAARTGRQGPAGDSLIGLVRFTVDRDDGEPTVIADILPPPLDRTFVRRDLVAALRYL
jgi:hypothetical protein